MSQTDFTLKIPKEQRHIRMRLNMLDGASSQLQKLIIIATGLNSHMDKESQVKTATTYQKAGFATLQFNFMGHGVFPNRSEGHLRNLTLSENLKDLTTVWDYAQTLSSRIDTKHVAINANSYGALISLMALEQRMISPESMVLVAPFSLEKYKTWILPLRLIAKLMPDKISTLLKLPISSDMLQDFLQNHAHAMSKKDLLGNTAVHFFIGTEDTVSSYKDIKKWCKKFNAYKPDQVPFVGNKPAHIKTYKGVPHFHIPQSVHEDIMARSIAFIRETQRIRSC